MNTMIENIEKQDMNGRIMTHPDEPCKNDLFECHCSLITTTGYLLEHVYFEVRADDWISALMRIQQTFTLNVKNVARLFDLWANHEWKGSEEKTLHNKDGFLFHRLSYGMVPDKKYSPDSSRITIGIEFFDVNLRIEVCDCDLRIFQEEVFPDADNITLHKR